eukprot:UN10782
MFEVVCFDCTLHEGSTIRNCIECNENVCTEGLCYDGLVLNSSGVCVARKRCSP